MANKNFSVNIDDDAVKTQYEQEQKQPQGWRDVVITPDMPLAALVQFFNILNQLI